MKNIDTRTIDGGGSILQVDDNVVIVGEIKRTDLPPEWVEIEVFGSDYVSRSEINSGMMQHKLRDAGEWLDGPAPQ